MTYESEDRANTNRFYVFGDQATHMFYSIFSNNKLIAEGKMIDTIERLRQELDIANLKIKELTELQTHITADNIERLIDKYGSSRLMTRTARMLIACAIIRYLKGDE